MRVRTACVWCDVCVYICVYVSDFRDPEGPMRPSDASEGE